MPTLFSMPDALFSSFNIRRSIGAGMWVVIVASAVAAYDRLKGDRTDAASSPKVTWFTPVRDIDAHAVDADVRIGDPVFYRGPSSDAWVQAGYISDVTDDRSANQRQDMRIRWYVDGVAPQTLVWESHRTTGSLQEVVQTMLPPEKRQRIQSQIQQLLKQNGQEMTELLQPLVRESLVRSLPVIERGVRRSMAEHSDQWQGLAGRLQTEILDQRIMPLAKQEMMPIVRRHGQPITESIGRELWDRASLWRFGWRALYDQTPLGERSLVKEEWQRFVDEEAVPVFEDHLDEIVVAVQNTMSDVAANPVIRQELASVAGTIADDPEAQRLLKTVLRESIVENQELRTLWKEIWTSPDAVAALDRVGDRVEPVVRQIGDLLFGTPEQGIDPNFARVLRNQILRKDRRWIVAFDPSMRAGGADATSFNEMTPAGDSYRPVVRPAQTSMPYPVVYLASE
ncbi:hypothetical protein [Crateriforma conspicua]|uniref:Uncharacterized protein n=1 Tax=Crateriforma conspicua TaxID=2527996 RepID=A0A5C5Y0U3_9PLAN|nr:hypothetical protein [Crateriforma conspicua]TWT68271.1 hypothetical protein Pan14r_05150 [Crateriforma conspicua]